MRTSLATETLDKVGVGLVYRIGSTPIFKKAFRHWYSYMTRQLSNQEDVVFLNWGYEEEPAMALPLDDADAANRYSIQLYHQVATQVDISGKKVLEVSCGHGGGASYLARTLKPGSYTGLDFNADGVAYCSKRHDLPGLDFVHGDAENLPFPDESFDAVINVEASHIYPHFDRFVSEVSRVLRPGGHFLHTDFRNQAEFADWDAVLSNSGMSVTSKKNISDRVLRGLRNNSAKSNDLINRNLPAFLRKFGREFAVVDGSWFYRDLERGAIEYRTYCLTKD